MADIDDTIIHEVCHLPHPAIRTGKTYGGMRYQYLPDNQKHRQLQAAVRAILRADPSVIGD